MAVANDSRLAGLSGAAVAQVTSAMALLQQRDVAGAERLLKAADDAADHPEVLRLLGMAARLQGRNEDALHFMRRAAAQRPNDALVQNGLATALDAVGEHDAALDAFRRAYELAPDSPQLAMNYGRTLFDRGRYDEAIIPLETAVARHASNDARHRLAYALRVVGDTSRARHQYRELASHNPDDAEAWLALSNLRGRDFSDADIATLRARWASASTHIDQRISFGFALARALEDHARFAESFRVLTDVNALTRSIRPWDSQDFRRYVERIVNAPAPSRSTSDVGNNVVFVVSLPRSGSSLIEHILASHPDVMGAGELMEMSVVLEEESQRRHVSFPDWMREADAECWRRLGDDYLGRTARFQSRALFIDKMPDNWLHIGAAMAMLPGARIIDCRRDPVEAGLSCFRTLFAGGAQAFSYDLFDIADYHRQYVAAMDVWNERFGSRLRRQSYEALIDDPREQIAQLLQFCGLPYDAACERFYETRRTVRTASAGQVREPLMRDTARAAHYGALLDPLRETLNSLPDASRSAK